MVYCPNPVCLSSQNDPPANFCQVCGTPLTLAGRYRLRSILGEGGSGRTFLAENVTGEKYIVKQLYGAQLYKNSSKYDFSAASERLQKIGEHPQIPRLIETVEIRLESQTVGFWVQEFVPGDNLGKRVEKNGPWTQMQARSLLAQLVPVLQYVHSFNVIHRDIKPANIISPAKTPVQSLGQDDSGLPMLVDFGAAKWISRAPAKTVIGSADYAAPEQTMGQATFASDVYSLGLTCLHLLTSIHPFALYSIAEDRWVWQDYLPQPIEPRFAQVLDQMVARSLQQRYESFDQVALDLQFSQNPLRYAPKQLLTLAKEAAAPFIGSAASEAVKGVLQTSLEQPPNRSLVVASEQKWRCLYRLTEAIGVTQAIALNYSPASPPPPTLATAGTDGSIRLWHLPSGQLIHTFHRRRLIGNGHTAAITALRFHPDGRALYSASVDGTIKEWDSAERCLLNTLPNVGWTPTDLAVTPDGTQLVSPYSDGQIALWNIARLQPAARLTQHQKSVNAVAFSARGDLLASASDDGTIKLWRWQRSQKPQLAKTISLEKSKSWVGQKMFGQQGLDVTEGAIALALYPLPYSSSPHKPSTQQLIAATSSGLVLRYTLDAQSNPGEPEIFYQSPFPITAFALSADGTLAIGSEDSVLTLWNLSTGECVAKLAHNWGLVAVAFTADGQTLITASADEVISVWQREL